MKVVGIIGSPKTSHSMSSALVDAVFEHLEGAETERIATSGISVGTVAEAAAGLVALLKGTDALVISFPLYVDGLPSHLLRLLEALGAELREGDVACPTVYVTVNCGFLEPEHTALVIEQVRLWCNKTGLPFGRALALGGGGIGDRIPVGYGPLKRAGKAAKSLAGSILALAHGETIFVKIGLPRFIYIIAGHASWRSAAKKRGLVKGDLLRRP
jgi:NAD(P)H-dependent FMN reductase